MFEAATAAIEAPKSNATEVRSFTKLPNDVMEFLIQLFGMRSALVIWVIRQTLGYHRKWTRASVHDLAVRFHKTPSAIKKAVRLWEKRGVLLVQRDVRGSIVRLALAPNLGGEEEGKSAPQAPPQMSSPAPQKQARGEAVENLEGPENFVRRPREESSQTPGTLFSDPGKKVLTPPPTNADQHGVEPPSKDREQQKQKTKKVSVNKSRMRALAMHACARRTHDERRTSKQAKLPGFPTYLELRDEHRINFGVLFELWMRHVGKSDRESRALMSYLWAVLEPNEVRTVVKQLANSRTNLMGYANKVVRAMN